jgi:hypothetical protein
VSRCPSPILYSPECVEEEFSEVRLGGCTTPLCLLCYTRDIGDRPS